jgi:RNA polymerase sigma factor (sigma-70 family)
MKVIDISEENMLSGCIGNERQSQELLYKQFARKMYAVCLSYAGERPLAQDMLQEAFIKVFKNIHFFKQNGSLEGWIRRIVTNTAIDHIRKRKRDGYFIEMEPDDPLLHTQNAAPRILGFNELMEQVERLPAGARVIFNMHALDGYSHKEIAEQLKISEGTSKSQFNRARKLLINLIGNVNL